jgi:hypothetical protein
MGYLCFGAVMMSYVLGCPEEKVKPECVATSDCAKDDVICVEGKCQPLGDINDPCRGGADCLLKSKQTNKSLVCKAGKCTERCETNFDCELSKGEICDRVEGVCIVLSPDGGETVTEEGPGLEEGQDCAAPTARCGQGLSCIEQSEGKNRKKRCWKTCSASTDCAAGRACAAGHCVPVAEVCSFNAQGTLDDPCWPGLTCVREGIVEGSCYQSCSQASECLTGQVCEEVQPNQKFCKSQGKQAGAGEACGQIGGEQVGCITGYGCIAKAVGSSERVCTKQCTQASDCQEPTFCSGGYCTAGNVGTAKELEACKTTAGATDQERCEAGLYCLIFQGKESGLCYKECRTDPTACGSAKQCVNFSAANTNLCLQTCTEAANCAAPTASCASVAQGGPTYCVHQ